jgi:hypothetical protein
MSSYNVLEWQDENSLTSYPLTEELEVQGIFVSANFIQFDNFIPVLNELFVDSESLKLKITFDFGQHTALSFTKQRYNMGEAYRYLRIYTPDKSRYLGVLSFGRGAHTLWSEHVGRKFEYSLPFDACTVRSVSSDSGVYLLDGSYGAINMGRTSNDSTIFYNMSSSSKTVTFNAVTGHSVEAADTIGLRKINLVSPVKNNINLAANDVIKFNPKNASALSIDLVAGVYPEGFNVPTLFQ